LPIRRPLSPTKRCSVIGTLRQARRQSDMSKVPPFYLDVIWHPEHGRFQQPAAGATIWSDRWFRRSQKKQRLTRKLFDAGAQPVSRNPMSHNPSSSRAPACLRKWRCLSRPGSALNRSGSSRHQMAGDRLGLRGLGRVESRCSGRHLIVSARSDRGDLQYFEPGGRGRGGQNYIASPISIAPLQSSEAVFHLAADSSRFARRGAERALAWAARIQPHPGVIFAVIVFA